MTLSFQDKIKPVATSSISGLSFADKIKPVTQLQPEKKKSILGSVAGFLAPTTTGLLTGEKEVTGRSLLGAGLEIGSYLIPTGAIAKGLGLAGKAGIRTAQAIKTAKKAKDVQKTLSFGQKVGLSAGIGGASAGTFEAGQAVADPEAGIGDIAKRTATGAAFGTAFGAGIPVAGRAVGATLRKVAERAPTQRLQEMTRNLRTLQNTYEEGIRKQKVGGKVVEVSNPLKTLKERKLVPEVVNERTDTTKIVESLTNEIEQLSAQRSPTIAKSKATVSLKQFTSDVKKTISSSKELRNSGQVTSTIKKAQTILNDFKQSFGSKLPLQVIDDIRVVMNKRFDPDLKDAFRAIGDTARKNVYRLDKASQPILRKEGELLSARRFAEVLNNRPVKGGRLGGYMQSLVGAMVGGSLQIPVAGPLIGAFGGRALDRAIRNAYFKAPGAKTSQKLLDLGKRADEAVYKNIKPVFGRPKSQGAISKTIQRPEVFGALGGIERDEKTGKVEFSPEKAALSVGGLAAFTRGKNIETGQKVFSGLKNLSTKLLEQFKGMPEKIKPGRFEEILNKAKKGGIKEVDEKLVRSSIVMEKGEINLSKTAAKVEEQLVPLTPTTVKSPRWSNIGEEFIGDGKYGEIVYQSPIKTSAGDVHFSAPTFENNLMLLSQTERRTLDTLNTAKRLGERLNPKQESELTRLIEKTKEKGFPNYFSHVRYEDMADGKTRKILETQSDLMQKDRFSQKVQTFGGIQTKAQKAEIAKLEPYSSNDPLAQLRTFREEVKRAAKDGKDTLLIPSGETAMKIEGLGSVRNWGITGQHGSTLKPDQLKVGMSVFDRGQQGDWIITDVLGEGKFKAVPKGAYERAETQFRASPNVYGTIDEQLVSRKETFDISGKVDTKHFVYKLNEESIPREARKMGLEVEGNYQIPGFEEEGVWWKIQIPKERGNIAVEAFGHAKIGTIIGAGTALGVGVTGASLIGRIQSTEAQKSIKQGIEDRIKIGEYKDAWSATRLLKNKRDEEIMKNKILDELDRKGLDRDKILS